MRKLKPMLIALALAGLFLGMRALDMQERLREALAWIDGLGPWGPLVFIGIYILATVLFIPGSLLTLGAGLLFGVIKGSIFVSIASTLGAGAAFLVGRYLARNWVAGKLAGNAKFKAIDEAVGGEGWKIVGLTRLSPIFPFNLLNYAYGLTSVSFRDYFLASWIGMMPGTLMFVYLGSLAGDLATLGAGGGAQPAGGLVLKIVGIVATIGVTVYITRIARRALDERLQTKT